MKHMKRIAALALAVMMLLSLTITASAAEVEATTYSITINNSAAGHTYEAYQIFKGDLSNAANSDENAAGTDAVLSNIEWGDGVTYNVENAVAADVAAALAKGELSLDAFLKNLTLTDPSGSTSEQSEGKYVISGLEPGYYLIKDQDNSLDGDNDSYTSYIIEVIENSVVSPKGDKPSSQKKVKDTDDTAGTTTDWQDSADYDIGDAVPFQLTATLPSDLDSYNKYYLAFHDTQSAGLTFNSDSVKVYVDNVEVTDNTKYSVVTDPTDDCTFEIIIPDVKAIGAKANSKITVEYTSTLNEDAVLGSAGNPNQMHIEYSNNPNLEWNGEGKPGDTGETPDDKVIVFTYKVIVDKVNEAGTALPGAGFTLYKKNAEGEWVKIGEELTGEAMTQFEWTGLDDGDYKLEETTTPAGYNTIAPIEFTISATHDTESDDPKLTALTGGDMFTGDVSTGALSGKVINKAGTTLPETGGIGTTIFYAVGGIMVLFAVILLVTKKRMASAE